MYPWRRRPYRRPYRAAPLDRETLALHARLPITDLHSHPLFHLTYWGNDLSKRHRAPRSWNPIGGVQWDLPRALEAAVKLQLFTVYPPMRPPRRFADREEAYRQIDVFDAFVTRNAGRIGHARSIEEAAALNAQGKLAAMLCAEGGHVLGGDPGEVAKLRARGVRYLTLVHFADNGLVQGVEQRLHRQEPLTERGREVLAEMQTHKMIIDVAHCTRASFDAVAAHTDQVLVSTHTGVQALSSLERNLADEQLDEIARRGGLVGVIALGLYLKKRVRADVRDMADVFCYLAERIGTKHIGLGTDWDGFIWAPMGLKGVEELPRLTAELLGRGFTEDQLADMLGGNAQRLLARFDA